MLNEVLYCRLGLFGAFITGIIYIAVRPKHIRSDLLKAYLPLFQKYESHHSHLQGVLVSLPALHPVRGFLFPLLAVSTNFDSVLNSTMTLQARR